MISESFGGDWLIIATNDKTIVLPVEMESGDYLEFEGGKICTLYGKMGEIIATVEPEGKVPLLAAGENRIRFWCDGHVEPPVRVKLTIISHGKPL